MDGPLNPTIPNSLGGLDLGLDSLEIGQSEIYPGPSLDKLALGWGNVKEILQITCTIIILCVVAIL